MTFSICVRERYEDDEGTEQTRFGVAVTTRLPAVGTLCPHASEDGAISTQSLTNVELGRKGIEYLGDGLAVEDALQALLNADDGASRRQLHGVGTDGTFVFSGEDCKPWYGEIEGDGYTVAGNLLVGESVVEATAETYAEHRNENRPLAERLIDALAAGQAEGGDKREDLHVQSAALIVETTEDDDRRYGDDLRVDASERPIEDLRETYERAREGLETLRERSESDDDERANDDEARAEAEDETDDNQ
jgi:uncharacterized Ntn-hydrolase superfamily protein